MKETKQSAVAAIRPVSRLADQTVSGLRLFFIRSVRRRAAELLELKPGDRVIDAGCGSGGSFPFLVAEIGDAGEIAGIEISPESTDSARRRIGKNGWSNVSVITAPAQEANLEGMFDALLMFAAPDVFASPAAWQNLGPYLKPNARVAFFGAKLIRRRVGVILNPVLRTSTGFFLNDPRTRSTALGCGRSLRRRNRGPRIFFRPHEPRIGARPVSFLAACPACGACCSCLFGPWI